LKGVSLARCYGIHYSKRQSIHLFLEFLRGCTPPKTTAHYELLAQKLGEFNGWAANQQIWREPWLRPDRGLAARSRVNALEDAIHAFLPQHEDQQRLLRVARRVARRSLELDRLEAATPSTLAHGDTHVGNVLISNKARTLYLIDWGRVCRSRIGYDLVKVSAPWTYILARGGRVSDYIEREDLLLGRYMDGVSTQIPREDHLTIKRYYYLRSFVEGVRILPLVIQRYKSASSKRYQQNLDNNRAEFARFLVFQGERALRSLDAVNLTSPSA